MQSYFEPEDSPALPLWKELIKEALAAVMDANQRVLVEKLPLTDSSDVDVVEDLQNQIQSIAREVAKLDGFDVTMRSLEIGQQSQLKVAKHWIVPVREWARIEEWQLEKGEVIASHDENGLVRPRYVEEMLAADLYEKDALKEGLLDPDCIEARAWNLSASQYKPFDFTQLRSEKNVSDLITEMKATEMRIVSGLDKLLAMAEGRE